MKKLNPEELGINPNSKSADEIKQLTKDYVKYLTGKDVEVVIIATGDGSGYIRGDQNGEDKKDVFLLDVTDLVTGNISVADIYGHEPNHVDDHRRGRDAGDEVTSTAAGDRLSEILGDKGKSNGFDLSKWIDEDGNLEALATGREHLVTEYDGYEIEGYYKNIDHKKCVVTAVPGCNSQFVPKEQYEKIMEESKDTFAPFKDKKKNIVLTGDGDGENPKNSGKDTPKNPPINYGKSSKNIPVPKSIIKYTLEGAELIQDEVNKLNKGYNEWYNSLDFNEIDNGIKYAFSGIAQYGEGLIASGNPTSIQIGTFLMVPETGKDFGDLF